MNKKASISDAVFGPIQILVLVCTIIVGFYVWISFSGTFIDFANTASNGISAANNQSLNDAVGNITAGLTTLDYLIPLVVFGLMIVSLIFAFKTGSSIIYAILSILMWAFALLLSAVFTDMFTNFASAFPSVTGSFPIAMYIMANIKWIVLFWLFLISTIMFTRNKQEQDSIQAAETAFGGYS